MRSSEACSNEYIVSSSNMVPSYNSCFDSIAFPVLNPQKPYPLLTPQSHSSNGTKENHKDEVDVDDPANNLPHISEREPDDLDQDPSLHPTAGPLFVLRSNQASESKYVRDDQALFKELAIT